MLQIFNVELLGCKRIIGYTIVVIDFLGREAIPIPLFYNQPFSPYNITSMTYFLVLTRMTYFITVKI